MSDSISSRKLGMQRLAGSVMMAVCLFVQSDLSAQQVVVEIQGGQDRATTLYLQYMNQLKQDKTDAENRIGSRLEDIDRACNLTDPQRKKLMIASKGAVNAYMIEATKQIVMAAKQVGFDFEPDNPPEKQKADENNLVQARGFALLGAGQSANKDVENQKIWTNSVKKVLTDQQNETLAAWNQQRRSFYRRSAVDSFIAKVDLKLLLSPEQRKKLTLWVDKNYGQELANRHKLSQAPARQVFFFAKDQMVNKPTSIMEPELFAILSETQQDQWKKSFRDELEGKVGAVNFQPAIRLAPAAVFDFEDNDEDK